MALFADLALPLPVDQLFTYSVPESLQARICPGMRATAPVQGRVLTGYVVSVSESCAPDRVRALIDLPDEISLLAPEMIALCRWIADYYCCSLGEALACAAPPGAAMREKVRYTLIPEALATGRYTERQRKVIGELHRRGPLTRGQLAKTVGATALSNTLNSLVSRGVLLAERFASDTGVSARTETWVRLVETAILDVDALSRLQRQAPKQAAVYLDLLHGEPERPAGVLYDRHEANASILRALEAKGLVQRFEREFFRLPSHDADSKAATKHALNDEQREAFEAISEALDDRRFQTFLLKGITGSGKTEIYLQAIERVLEQGRDAIILVPEISLTPQTVGRFKARFHEDIAVLHSGLGQGERYDEWRRAQQGKVRIVVGARSAIFAPLKHVGIIVIDEEHDSSYKQSETPRYHARDVGIMRASQCGAVCVLGSATPSVESYYNSDQGKSRRLELRRRATKAELPAVQIVDMRIETKEAGPNAVLSRTLEQAVNERVAAGEQVLLLLNRRGYSPFVLCPACGWVAYCVDCQVTLTYHARGAHLLCHYCNYRREVPQVCDECFFNPLIFLGTGTQKVEDYLLRAFGAARVERMDADTTAGKGGHAKILGRLAQGDIDILIGTQMIAKGHDYPRVTLVGVINADTGLSLPEFRGAENTFQLITQVAGRAGRGALPGQVIVQTYRPRHYAIQTAARHDYEGFYAEEIVQRQRSGYPPYRRLANLMVEASDPLDAERAAATLVRLAHDQVQALGFEGIGFLGPSPATIRRLKRKYRWNLALLSKSPQRLNAAVRATRDAFHAASKTGDATLRVDLDPYGVF